MAELSDYEVAAGLTFLSNSKVLTTTFNSGGRNANKQAFAQISGLGGLKETQNGLSVRLKLNGTSIGLYNVRRYNPQAAFVFDQLLVDFSSNLLKAGDNTLVVEPQYSDTSDYCWIGPAIVHFRQNS